MKPWIVSDFSAWAGLKAGVIRTDHIDDAVGVRFTYYTENNRIAPG